MLRSHWTPRTPIGIAVFAVAMAYVESASVLYLRTLYGGIDPAARAGRPVTPVPDYIAIEVGREACTIVMLAAVGWLAGRHTSSRLAYFLAAFGIWDVCYYVWPRFFTGWPRGLLDWDVLFLIPLPWWGPVIAPCLVAAEMAGAGLWLGRLVDARGGLRHS